MYACVCIVKVMLLYASVCINCISLCARCSVRVCMCVHSYMMLVYASMHKLYNIVCMYVYNGIL